mmetsp:Transcript_74944/g.173793  ORF Transcript_74944/g.173793 Transcript_74944/m.173793 type:complete len:91 (+) Transcript_74944:53-325(+)|eukprot:CAMPEP_0171101534 /NCGR_PEP_ID=MMETSP0766_2-20121228/55303_1 /TAXON_ID=439317 /ORGANISM="Gambierdiscus australes, Strain CAWD 149" /LENGTH=90 /DNA_ID=CAMNT_0011561601 /DNA_START=50 /DNA_END=322 /DNA_ORIENTATION=+
MPGTLTVKTVQTLFNGVHQEIHLDIKPKGAAAQSAAKANPHDVGAQAFFMKGGAKSGSSGISVKAEEALRSLDVKHPHIEKVTPEIPRVM